MQHASLSPERWASFSLDQQVLMIANEMNRAGQLMGPRDVERQRSAYERVLNLTDLTVRVQSSPTFRRELLRWRDLIAVLYLGEKSDPGGHADAFRALLRMTPEASKQIEALLQEPS
jgi:hypothetical protein